MSESPLTAFERIEIQMRYVVPLLRDLQAELGEDVILDALRARLARRVEQAGQGVEARDDLTDQADGLDAGFAMFAKGDVLDYEVIARDGGHYDADVHACGYARLMAELEATDIGSLLICGEDDVWAASVGVHLTRTQTRMQGGTHCDFRFRPQAG